MKVGILMKEWSESSEETKMHISDFMEWIKPYVGLSNAFVSLRSEFSHQDGETYGCLRIVLEDKEDPKIYEQGFVEGIKE